MFTFIFHALIRHSDVMWLWLSQIWHRLVVFKLCGQYCTIWLEKVSHMLQYVSSCTRCSSVVPDTWSLRLQVSFVWPYLQHVVHHTSLLLKDSFLMVCYRCSMFSSSLSVDEEVDGSSSSDSTCCYLCKVSL